MAPSRRTLPRPTGARSDALEKRTRSKRGFADAESSLSSVSTSQTQVSRRHLKITSLLSYLGSSNPLPAQIVGDDVIWLMDNVAFRDPRGAWQAEFVTAAFDQQPSDKVVDIVGDIASKLGLSRGHVEEKTIERRIAPFVMEILPGRQIKVNFGGSTQLKLGPGDRHGISSDVRRILKPPPDMAVRSTADVPMGVAGILDMKTVYAEPEGWAVISDVDDTIKITQTSDPVGILRSTFVSEPTPVPGMPDLYAYLQSMVTTSAPFFYLSASPYNLYPFLRGFRDTYFPHGQLILRDASWMTISGLLSSLTLGTQKYKVDRMKKIHRWLPRRKTICIGDSTQSDPEAYGEICRMFPGWIKLILIRKVTDIAAVGIEDKNEPARFEKAFAGIPRETWHVFEDPAECWELIHRTVAG
ncbi:Phosphatidate phosphatase APP1 [Madurella mycetomatis]|uniref:Phosphatidate phosphatase APP1 n=1 Tax=Madurella mycetomatis TaxID=100816 RepID=A0A175VWW1_9PEZI|nr:Phosphatidate phosphatase APP1 [Madurella mycetomatis]